MKVTNFNLNCSGCGSNKVVYIHRNFLSVQKILKRGQIRNKLKNVDIF